MHSFKHIIHFIEGLNDGNFIPSKELFEVDEKNNGKNSTKSEKMIKIILSILNFKISIYSFKALLSLIIQMGCSNS